MDLRILQKIVAKPKADRAEAVRWMLRERRERQAEAALLANRDAAPLIPLPVYEGGLVREASAFVVWAPRFPGGDLEAVDGADTLAEARRKAKRPEAIVLRRGQDPATRRQLKRNAIA